MAASVWVEVADAIVTALQELDQKLVVVRSWGDVSEELTYTGKAQVDVVPWATSADLESAGYLDYSSTYDIMIRKKFDETVVDTESGLARTADVDAMVKLLQDIWEILIPSPPTTTGTLTTTSGYVARFDPVSSRILSLNMRAQLKRLRQYTALIRVGYVVTKTAG